MQVTEYVHIFHDNLHRKFTPEDVTPKLAECAIDYLNAYTGNFEFLLDLKSKASRGLSNAQIKGVLNCIISQPQPVQPVPNVQVAPVLIDGTYTIVLSDESDYVTLKLHTPKEGSLKDRQIASYLYGPDNTSDFTGFAFTNPLKVWSKYQSSVRQITALNALLSSDDPQAYGLAYALRSGNCYKCGRKLTVPASLHRGMGPVCAAGGID